MGLISRVSSRTYRSLEPLKPLNHVIMVELWLLAINTARDAFDFLTKPAPQKLEKKYVSPYAQNGPMSNEEVASVAARLKSMGCTGFIKPKSEYLVSGYPGGPGNEDVIPTGISKCCNE